MEKIDGELRPSLPVYVKQFGVTVKEPFKLDGKPKAMVSRWSDEEGMSGVVKGPFTRIFYEPMNLGSDKQVKEFLLSLGWEPTWWNIRKKDTAQGKAGERTSPK